LKCLLPSEISGRLLSTAHRTASFTPKRQPKPTH
jgi:hypothetical protein